MLHGQPPESPKSLSETIQQAGLPHEQASPSQSSSPIARQEPSAKAASLAELEPAAAWGFQMRLAAIRARAAEETDTQTTPLGQSVADSGDTFPDSSHEQSEQPMYSEAWSGLESREQQQHLAASSTASVDDAAQDKMFRTRRQQFLRTQFCTFYQQGRCLRGDKCTFAHTIEQVRDMPDLRKTTLCQAWMWRSCPLPKDMCAFAHGRADLRTTEAFWRTSLCKMHMRGKCQQGDNCRYAHGPEELRRD
mmetsp:Transcript_2722/g.4597  ORF Transcript_2722/g.4597 Transcript_2722/m.4597 type:complete len:249 (-) Transcript_2722:61-807(-)